jgi:hypothetical protein
MARTMVQTSCSRCGADVEGYLSAPHDWRDRGNNTECHSWSDRRLAYDQDGVPRPPPRGKHTVARAELRRQAYEGGRIRRAETVQRMGERAYAARYGRSRNRANRRRLGPQVRI